MSATESDARASPLLITYTEFPRANGPKMTRHDDVEWGELVARVEHPQSYPNKKACPLITLCEYGETIDEHHDIPRYAANVQRAFGAEVDYDGERVPCDEDHPGVEGCDDSLVDPAQEAQRPAK